jgi:hypothetical protein
MSLLIIGAALVLGAAYVHLLVRRVDAGLISLLLVELVYQAVGPNATLFGPIHLSPVDAVSLCLFIAGIIRASRVVRSIHTTRLLALGYVALLAFSLIRGIIANGMLIAGNEARGFIGPLVATLYFLTAPADIQSVRKYTRCYLYFGAALCAIAALAAAGVAVGMSAWDRADAAAIEGRYLPADGAAAIAVCGFLSLAVMRYHKRGFVNQLVPVTFMAVAIYLRHRTVWVMLLVGVAALLPLDARLFRRILPAALLAVALVALLAVYGGNVEGLASENQFSQSVSNGQTFAWRLNGWKELLFDEEQNALTVAVGKSMGSGYVRIDPVSYQVIAVAPHSEYIQEYLRVGVVGVFMIVLFALRPLVRLWRLAKVDPTAVYPSTSAWAIVVLITLVYGISYNIQPQAYALIGIANAIAMAPAEDTAEQEDEEAWQMELAAEQTEATRWA